MTVMRQIVDVQSQILKSLAVCEGAIGELYNLYEKYHPEMGEFWGKLAAEERIHATMLEEVRASLINHGVLMHGLDHFKVEQVQFRIDFVRRQIENALEQPPTAEQAVMIALNIESSIIDSRFFEFAKSDGSEFQIAAHKLAHETHDHIKMVQAAKAALEQRGKA